NYSVLPAGRSPVKVVLADVNADGLADLITANANNTVSVFAGLRGGSFATTPTVLTLPAGATPRDLLVTDLNQDGRPDIATANFGTDNISVFFNQSTGGISFAAPTNVNGGMKPVALVAADFDRDGVVDLATVSGVRDTNNNFDVNLLLGTATGFAAGPI